MLSLFCFRDTVLYILAILCTFDIFIHSPTQDALLQLFFSYIRGYHQNSLERWWKSCWNSAPEDLYWKDSNNVEVKQLFSSPSHRPRSHRAEWVPSWPWRLFHYQWLWESYYSSRENGHQYRFVRKVVMCFHFWYTISFSVLHSTSVSFYSLCYSVCVSTKRWEVCL